MISKAFQSIWMKLKWLGVNKSQFQLSRWSQEAWDQLRAPRVLTCLLWMRVWDSRPAVFSICNWPFSKCNTAFKSSLHPYHDGITMLTEKVNARQVENSAEAKPQWKLLGRIPPWSVECIDPHKVPGLLCMMLTFLSREKGEAGFGCPLCKQGEMWKRQI